MSSYLRRLTVAAAVVVLGVSVGCTDFSAGIGGGVAFVQFTIGGKTYTFSFGTVGPIDVRANQTTRVPVGFDALFERKPTDVPPSGQMTLPAASVGVGRRLAEKSMVSAQALPLDGSITVRLFVARGIGADLCDSAALLAEYEYNYTTGVVSTVSDTYELSTLALDILASNSVTICIEITADFDSEITLGEFSFSFGGGGGGGAADFNLHNTDIFENIHILLPGEDFDSSNRLVPGASRTVTLTDLATGEVVTARAGRNGVVLDTADCPAVTGTNYQADVVWDGASVTCTATQDDTGTGTDGEGVTPGTIIQVPIDNEGGLAVPSIVNLTVGGVDYSVAGVLEESTPDAPSASPDPAQVSINLQALGLESVQRIYLGTATAWVPEVSGGVTIATLYVDYAEGGEPTTLDLVLGSNTAEWSYDRPEHVTELGGVQHARPTELYSFPTTIDSAFEYLGYAYAASVSVDSSRTVSCLTLEIIDQNVLATLKPQSDVPTWAAQAVSAVTLEGPAGTPPLVGDCSGVTVPTVGDLGSISGTVVDAETGDPIAGASVALDGLGAMTDAAGEFLFTDVPVGTATVTASADGYQDGTETATVLPGVTTPVTIELTPETEAIGTINGTVTNAVTAAPLAGALVRLDYSPGPAVSATTGANGTYNMLIPEIPDFFALTASLAGYIPESTNVQRSSLEGTAATVNFALDPTNPGVVVIEIVPDVHHLGDDSFSGAANSQFQKTSEGLTYTATFQVTADQLPPAYNNAELRALAKGTENDNPITINGTTLDNAFLGTPADGSFGEWTTTFDIALLVTGSNTITITSAISTDYDDFEFVNVQIRLSP